MKHTKESLGTFTSNELIELVLSLQQELNPNTISNITPEALFSWLKDRRRGVFVTATKRNIMEHFNCTSTQYTNCMRSLYSDGSLEANIQYGKRIISSHKIKGA